MNETKLYRKNAIGIGTWRIFIASMGVTDAQICYAHAVVANGSEVRHYDVVQTNQSGRNIQQQVELEMQSRISRMRDKGYKDTIEEAGLGSTNQMNLLNPMLAQSLSKVSPKFTQGHVQPKFDGHRCLITNVDGNIIPYSRRGKPILTIPHIIDDFKWLPPGKTVDGELYIHGQKLQTISSLIKRQQDGSSGLKYHWYDYVSHKPFDQRLADMEKAAFAKPMEYVEVVPSFKVRNLEQVHKLFTHFRDDGYEGAMLRLSTGGYQPNVRASQLLKVKEREDMEVKVTGAWPARDGSAILHCRMPNGKEFDTLAPGSIPEKQAVMNNIEKYAGRKLTIEYAMLTDDGIPFHAVATRWHEEV